MADLALTSEDEFDGIERSKLVDVSSRADGLDERESKRLAAVRRYSVAGLPPNGAFQDIVAIAAEVFDAPIAIVSIVDEDQILFPARLGLDVSSVERRPGLCASAILRDVPTVIADTRFDPVAMTHPLVAGAMGLRFYVGAPLRTSDGHNLGTVCVLDREPREVQPGQLAVLEHLAALVVQQLELRRSTNTVMELESELRRRADDERDRMAELAAVLQAALLPPELPEIPGIELAARYRPADRSVVGGDFYDAFRLRSGWGLMLGDVCGKGPAAATVATAARHGLRAAAADHSGPADALRVLNQTLLFGESRHNDDTAFCTIVYGQLRRATDGYRVTVACGGHPPAVVVRANGDIEDLGRPGTLIGSFEEVSLFDRRTTLRSGDSIILFSDGLSESIVSSGLLERTGIHRLLEGSAGLSASEILDVLDPVNHGARQRDDLAMLVARIQD